MSSLRFPHIIDGCCGPLGPVRLSLNQRQFFTFQCKNHYHLANSLVTLFVHFRPGGQGPTYVPPHVTEGLLHSLELAKFTAKTPPHNDDADNLSLLMSWHF